MARGVRLTKRTVFEENMGFVTSRRLVLEVDLGCDMDENIFVYREQIVDSTTNAKKGTFLAVATSKDLDELAVDVPNDDGLFLKDFVDLVVRSPITLNEVFDAILADIQALVDTLNALDELEVDETVLIGA